MIRLVAVAFALAVATSAQAMSPAPLQQPDDMVTQIREACGAGRVRINGVCVARTTKRQVRSNCGAGMRHSVVARLHPPAAMSGGALSQAATEESKKPDSASAWSGFLSDPVSVSARRKRSGSLTGRRMKNPRS